MYLDRFKKLPNINFFLYAISKNEFMITQIIHNRELII